jgi:O-acetyl-ADP-ribose deacetylase (regulator of RNase III)
VVSSRSVVKLIAGCFKLTQIIVKQMLLNNTDSRIAIAQGDITKLEVDAIVNAANTSLLGGGGVDGAIHRAAGRELLEECRQLRGCATGEAKITKGYKLPAKWVIHTVGPVWRGGDNREDELLARCYRSCLALTEPNEIKTIAFPGISTGAYGFPMERAARIALTEVREFLEKDTSLAQVIFVAFGDKAYNCYQQAIL